MLASACSYGIFAFISIQSHIHITYVWGERAQSVLIMKCNRKSEIVNSFRIIGRESHKCVVFIECKVCVCARVKCVLYTIYYEYLFTFVRAHVYLPQSACSYTIYLIRQFECTSIYASNFNDISHSVTSLDYTSQLEIYKSFASWSCTTYSISHCSSSSHSEVYLVLNLSFDRQIRGIQFIHNLYHCCRQLLIDSRAW